MSIETPGDSPILGSLFTVILGELESQQQQGSQVVVNEYLQTKLSDLVKSQVLSQDKIDDLKAKLSSLKGKQIKQLQPADFLFVKALFNQAMRDSGCEDYLEPRSSLIQNGINILQYGRRPGPFDCQVKECAMEMSDAGLKAEFVKFCIERQVDLTSNIRDLPKTTFVKMSEFLEEKAKQYKKEEDLDIERCVEFLSEKNMLRSEIAELAKQEKILQPKLEKKRRLFKEEAQKFFQGHKDLLRVGADDAEAEHALNPSQKIEIDGQEVDVCSQAVKDFFGEAPRTSHTSVKTPYMSLMRLDSRANAQELYKQLELLAHKIHPEAVPREKIRLINILLFFCSQHPSNACLSNTRFLISTFLSANNDRFSLENEYIEIKLSPVFTGSEIVPNQFFLVYDATLSVRPSISLELAGNEEKKIAKQALDKVGLGSCFTTTVSATMRVDCSTVNPEVDIDSFNIV
jgi:hypothetical protein